jgi:hypothetical protein
MDVKRLLIAWTLGEIPTKSLPEIAWEMMEIGLESPDLRALAAFPPAEDTEIAALFIRAFRELGLQSPTVDDALLERARDVAAGITDGSINPFEGAYRIWLIRRDQGGPDVLEPFGRIVQQDLAEVDALLHSESPGAADLLRDQRTEIDHRYEGLILSEARHLVSAGAACLGADTDYD